MTRATGADETAEQLRDRMVDSGVRLLLDTLDRGLGTPVPQEGEATYAAKLEHDCGVPVTDGPRAFAAAFDLLGATLQLLLQLLLARLELLRIGGRAFIGLGELGTEGQRIARGLARQVAGWQGER